MHTSLPTLNVSLFKKIVPVIYSLFHLFIHFKTDFSEFISRKRNGLKCLVHVYLPYAIKLYFFFVNEAASKKFDHVPSFLNTFISQCRNVCYTLINFNKLSSCQSCHLFVQGLGLGWLKLWFVGFAVRTSMLHHLKFHGLFKTRCYQHFITRNYLI